MRSLFQVWYAGFQTEHMSRTSGLAFVPGSLIIVGIKLQRCVKVQPTHVSPINPAKEGPLIPAATILAATEFRSAPKGILMQSAEEVWATSI